MALSINQTPALVSLAQSPIIFSVIESNTAIVANNGFQYVADLYYWTGTITSSGSVADYTLTKYPNTNLYGIFDLNRIINSTLTDLAQANPSNVEYFAVDFYWQYISGSSYVTGSHVKSDTYKALDGYQIFQESIGEEIYNLTPHWPLMTDGPATQSYFDFNSGSIGIYAGSAGMAVPDRVIYSGSNGNAVFSITGGTSTASQIRPVPIGPKESGFPLSSSVEWFSIQPAFGINPYGDPIRFELQCKQKYPNVRIKWKNRYGQFDWMNFDMVNRQSFQSERRTYQPQLGTWGSSELTYNNYDSSTLNYISDSRQTLSVNSNWLSEDYNNILKQLLVSDEIYWIYDESTNDLRPITIVTDSITFKTGVNDKLIQYQFDFNWGQNYKLII